MRLIRSLIGTMILFGVCSGVAVAGLPNCGDQPIRLAFHEYGILYSNGIGINKDIADEIIRRSGCKFETSVLPWARILNNLAAGTLEMGMSGIDTPERGQIAWFAHYFSGKTYVVIRADLAQTVRSTENFMAQPQLQIGIVTSYTHGPHLESFLERLRQDKRVQEVPDTKINFVKLQHHRIDALLTSSLVFGQMIHDLGLVSDVVVQDWAPAEKRHPVGLIMSKHRFSESDVEPWRDLLRQMRTDGTLKKIYTRYLPEDEANKMLTDW